MPVRLTPRAASDTIESIHEAGDGTSVLKARVRSVPEKGKANAALATLVAKWLGVAKSDVSVISGAKSRLKMVKISGDPGNLSARLAQLLKS